MSHRHPVLAAALAALAALLTGSAAIAAGLGGEVAAGRAVAQRLDAGTVACDDLARDDFEHLGEYVMSRMAGSADLHRAMNDRMRGVMGAANEERMHVAMGQRFAGCGTDAPRGRMGQGMMRGAGTDAGAAFGPMMRSSMWSWMRDGRWQRMDRAAWRTVSDRWIGPGMMRTGDRGWDGGDVALVAGGALLGAALLGGLVALRGRRRTTSA